MLPSILHYPLHLPLLFLLLFPFSNSTEGVSRAYLDFLAQSSGLSALVLCMRSWHSMIMRLWKRQTLPTPCRPFYKFLYCIISLPFPCSLYRGSFPVLSEPLICEVLYAKLFLTICMCSLIYEGWPLPSIKNDLSS